MKDNYCGYIYKITNLVNDKIYIGQTKQDPNKRWSNHKSKARKKKNRKNMAITNSIAQYGEEKFIFEVIDYADSPEKLNELEEYYIIKLNSLCPNGYNIQSNVTKQYVWKEDVYMNKINKKYKNASSKYLGVRLNKNKWMVSFEFNKNCIHVGFYNTEIEAAMARDIEVLKDKYLGLYQLNFPELRDKYLNNEITILTSSERSKEETRKRNKLKKLKNKKIKKEIVKSRDIYFNEQTNQYTVVITYLSQIHFIGIFTNEEEAIAAKNNKILELNCQA